MFSALNLHARLNEHKDLHIEKWQMQRGEFWAIAGTNGSGKSVITRLMSPSFLSKRNIDLLSGEIDSGYRHVLNVSFEAQSEMIDRERYLDETDITNEPDPGTLVKEYLNTADERCHELAAALGITHLYDQGLRSLSTGETRKVMLTRVLTDARLNDPDTLVVLDEALDGIDKHSRKIISNILEEYRQQGLNILLVANRLSELPEAVTHIAFMHDLRLLTAGDKHQVLNASAVQHLMHFDSESLRVPQSDKTSLVLEDNEPLAEIRNGKVSYGDDVIFDEVNWRIETGDNWVIQGPNGCGKTTLLQLISGDHPQCYSNNIRQFGIQRGSGESIWEIKQHIGLISASSQWEYRVKTNVISTVLSGLFDSIGLYNRVDDYQRQLAMEWLALINLQSKANEPLHSLSYGEQRMVLIARAMIKQPPLLILDEPCQGLDEVNRAMVLSLISRLSKQKKFTFLYVTHHEDEILPSFKHHLSFDNSGNVSKVRIRITA